MTSYLINEIYPCLQGEGYNIGKPSLLVRFQICNLRCSWCDTPYTHTYKSDPVDKNNPEGKQNFFRMDCSELIEKIRSFSQRHLILSGGEPTLQNIGYFMRELLKIDNYTFEIESNATRIPHQQIKGFLEEDYGLAQWNLSPKFSNANEIIEKEALSHWAKLSQKNEKVCFKFVVRESFQNQDMKEILLLLTEYHIPKDKIFLMPEGTALESQLNNIWLHDICLEHGFRYTPRLHIILFGNKRGV